MNPKLIFLGRLSREYILPVEGAPILDRAGGSPLYAAGASAIWEQEIGLLSPSKDLGGRRVYTLADLQLLFRIKYLIQERKFTVEGAAQRLLEEMGGESADAKARIHGVRAELLRLLDKIRGDRADTLK